LVFWASGSHGAVAIYCAHVAQVAIGIKGTNFGQGAVAILVPHVAQGAVGI
jgi:hypothetical protein